VPLKSIKIYNFSYLFPARASPVPMAGDHRRLNKDTPKDTERLNENGHKSSSKKDTKEPVLERV
jgi:hypothetical protein